MRLEVTDIQQGCTHDGPGLRTVVFLKGCPLRCRWCHNPETQSCKKELYYRPEKCIGCMTCTTICPQKGHTEKDGVHEFDPTDCIKCMACAENCPSGALEAASQSRELEDVMALVLADRVFYRNRGGLTVSGGEPTMQWDGLIALLDRAKEEKISTCLETCGVFSEDRVVQLLNRVDLFLYDIKDTDAERLRKNTGADLSLVLENLKAIDAAGGQTVLRCILIPEVNLQESHALALAELYEKLKNCRYVELLPYHPYGLSKSEQLGRSGVRFRQPEKEELETFAAVLQERNVPVKLYGSML